MYKRKHVYYLFLLKVKKEGVKKSYLMNTGHFKLVYENEELKRIKPYHRILESTQISIHEALREWENKSENYLS